MKTFMKHRNGANESRKPARPPRRRQSAAACAFEPLEGRQLFSVTGFSVVLEPHPPAAGTTIINDPTIFQSTLQSAWKSLRNGTMKINGQTMYQEIASAIQQNENSQGLNAYDISSSFDASPIYNGTLKPTSSGSEVQLTFEALGNETTWTSTTNSIFGSWADPTFHATYNLDLTVDLMLPSNLVTGKVTASASAVASDVTVSTSNVLVGIADAFGADIPGKIAAGINGSTGNLSSVVPTAALNSALQALPAQGYRNLLSSLNSAGNLVLTAQRSYAATPVITTAHGTYIGSVSVAIKDATPGASIRYTTNGATPTSSSALYKGPFTLTSSQTVNAVAFATDYAPSPVATASYTVAAATPELETVADGGEGYDGANISFATVAISDATPGAVIRYTTDNSTPTSKSPLYTAPFTLTKTTPVKAVAFKTGDANSGLASVKYVIIAPGELVGSEATAAASYDLTTLGTTDWEHWGPNYARMAGGTDISNVSQFSLGFKKVGYFYDGTESSPTVNWANGSPAASDTGDGGYIGVSGEGAGYSFTVPASMKTQTLYVLAGSSGGLGGTLEASLADGSAPTYGAYVNAGTDLFTITFKAGTPASTLNIKLTNGSLSGHVDLIAAALA